MHENTRTYIMVAVFVIFVAIVIAFQVNQNSKNVPKPDDQITESKKPQKHKYGKRYEDDHEEHDDEEYHEHHDSDHGHDHHHFDYDDTHDDDYHIPKEKPKAVKKFKYKPKKSRIIRMRRPKKKVCNYADDFYRGYPCWAKRAFTDPD